MEIVIDRKYKKQSYTIGKLFINGQFFSNTLEDADRGLDDSMSLSKILELKKPSITAIPKGTYKITLDVISPRFSSQTFYKEVCNGKLPRLLNVKGFEGVLIHCGNTAQDSSGCILVGTNSEKGKVCNSKDTFKKLYNILKEANNKGEEIIIKIK